MSISFISIETTTFILEYNKIHLNGASDLTDAEGHRWRSKITKNEQIVLSCKISHPQTYLVARYNKICDIEWHKISWPWRKVQVTPQCQRSQTWRSLRSLNAACLQILSIFLSSSVTRILINLWSKGRDVFSMQVNILRIILKYHLD